ncbi:hypothetical protein DL771_000509 [Monosporascus sp. 5C6A]|nr:hypothetical protein DL771_000509 [Monosporascus sp. 5C6A]
MLRTIATRRMAPIAAADIPTLNLLYKLKKLDTSSPPSSPKRTSDHNDRIGLIRADITSLAVDAIVNAANKSLLGGGGVDGAIHRAAGPQLLSECRTLNGCETGSSKITDAYNLPCKKVIHTVGPIYDEIRPERSKASLQGCYKSSLELAVQHGLKTVAFSCISTGLYGYPSRDAAMVACETLASFLDGDDGKKLDKVIFVTFEEKDVRAYNQALPRFFPPATATSAHQGTKAEADLDEGGQAEAKAETEAKANQLPSVPTTDPADLNNTQKKQKQKQDSEA